MRKEKSIYQSKTILTMVIAIVYAITEQLNLAVGADNVLNIKDINWGMIVTAVMAIVLRFFNDKKIKL